MSISREKRWIVIFACAAMLVTTAPYLVAYARQGADWQFTGFLIGAEDGNSYIAKMMGGSLGAWLFRTPHTTFPQQGLLAFFPYLLLGKLAAEPGLHEQLVALFHLFRIGAGILSILATYDFLSLFLESVVSRRIGTAIACLGGGLGWALVAGGLNPWLGSQSLDFYSPESFGFLELFGLPHLALARACLLCGLVAFLAKDPDRWYNKPVAGGVFFLLAGFFQPLTALVGWIVIGTDLAFAAAIRMVAIKRNQETGWQPWLKQVGVGAWILGISSPIVLYNVYTSLTDPFLRGWTAQNIITSPHPLHYLIAYGFIAPPAILGAVFLWRTKRGLAIFSIGWLLIFPILAYAPVNLQRRLPEGIWVVWVALAVAFFESPAGRGRRTARYWFLLSVPSTAFLILGSLMVTTQPGVPIYRPSAEIQAFSALGEQSGVGDVVLASFQTSNPLPAWTAVTVIVGHGPESIAMPELLPRVAEFYRDDTLDRDRLAFLQEEKVRFVFWGPFEKQLGNWDPHQADFMTSVYEDRSGYSIFKVVGSP